ncbi:hypothetical protein [Streptomyces sediminimaris]|uniref:hypothetical protein n=1 Tax=Streptomyces sediminimaris TaxID=3383721 RepID=UPI003999511E
MTAIAQGRTRRITLLAAMCALALAGTGVLAGCSGDPDAGTNGVGRLPAAKIQAKTRAAAASADSVHLLGNVVTNGRTYKLDMRLKSEGATGSVTSGGVAFGLLRIGEQLYLKAGAKFWKHAGGATDKVSAGKLDGKYVKVPRRDPAYKKFSGFTDMDVLLEGLLTLHGSLATDGHHEQSGTRTIRITGGKGSGGTLDVSLQGKPYPLRLQRAGGAGTIAFSSWGEDFALNEPEKNETVDYGKQLPTS